MARTTTFVERAGHIIVVGTGNRSRVKYQAIGYPDTRPISYVTYGRIIVRERDPARMPKWLRAPLDAAMRRHFGDMT